MIYAQVYHGKHHNMLLPRTDFQPSRTTFLIHPAQQRSRPRSSYIFDRLAMLYTVTRCLHRGYRDDCQRRIIHACLREPTINQVQPFDFQKSPTSFCINSCRQRATSPRQRKPPPSGPTDFCRSSFFDKYRTLVRVGFQEGRTDFSVPLNDYHHETRVC